MTRFIIATEALLSLACLGLAYLCIYTLEPANPLVPFILCAMCGGLAVDTWQRLGEALESGE